MLDIGKLEYNKYSGALGLRKLQIFMFLLENLQVYSFSLKKLFPAKILLID